MPRLPGVIRPRPGARLSFSTSAVLGLCPLLLAAACGKTPTAEPEADFPSEAPAAEAGEAGQEPVASAPTPQTPLAAIVEEQDCLVLVWEAQGSSDEAFDREHDDVAGGAISCANRQALDEAIRAAREAAGEGRGTPLDLPASDTRA